MIIAVHDRSTRTTNGNESKFIYEVLKRWLVTHPLDLIYFISQTPIQPGLSENLKVLIVEEPAFPFLRKKLYDKRIAQTLENIKADILISNDGYYCFKTTIPQCLIVHDSFEWEKYSKKSLEAASSVVVLHEATKEKLTSVYQINANKITNVRFGISNEIQPLNFEEQFIVKEDNTEGKEYLLASYPNDKNVLVGLLKAFSIFKKRQQTNMMLLIVSEDGEITDAFNSVLQNYKYRQDVILKYRTGVENAHDLMGAAYAYIDISAENLIPIAEAMKSGVPVITSEKARDLTGSAALFMEAHDHQQVAEQMMLMYKDESLRNELIKKASVIASQYTWDRTADLFWKVLKFANVKI